MADNVGVYEGMFIFDANRLARDREGLPGEVEKLIESAGGQLEVSRLWEERRLAYPIRGQRKGAYWITYFRMPTTGISGLTKHCEVHDGILRQLFVRLPDSLVEPILAHARGEKTAEEIEAEGSGEEAEAATTSENGQAETTATETAAEPVATASTPAVTD